MSISPDRDFMRTLILFLVSVSWCFAACTPNDTSTCPLTCAPGIVAGSSPQISLAGCDRSTYTSTPSVPHNNRLTWKAAYPSEGDPATMGIVVCVYGGAWIFGSDAGCPVTASLVDLIVTAELTHRAVYAFNYTLISQCLLRSVAPVGATTIDVNCGRTPVVIPNPPFDIILDYAGPAEETLHVTEVHGDPPTSLTLSRPAMLAHTGSACSFGSDVFDTCVPIVFVPMRWPRVWQDCNCFMHFLASNAGTTSVPGDPHDIVLMGASAGGTMALLMVPQIENAYAASGWKPECPYNGNYNVRRVIAGEPPTDFVNMAISSADTASRLCGGDPVPVRCNGQGALAIGRLFGCYPTSNKCRTLLERASPITYWDKTYPPLRMMWGGLDQTVPPAVDELALASMLSGQGAKPLSKSFAGKKHTSEYCEACGPKPNPMLSFGAYQQAIAWIDGNNTVLADRRGPRIHWLWVCLFFFVVIGVALYFASKVLSRAGSECGN